MILPLLLTRDQVGILLDQFQHVTIDGEQVHPEVEEVVQLLEQTAAMFRRADNERPG